MLHYSKVFRLGSDMQSIAKNTIRFAAFEVDLQSGVMCKHGLRIKLQDQPFKILVALLERPGEIVTRDELRERVWGNETFVDFDHGLSAAVNRLRDALSDSADNPRYVETVARRGYRFIAPLQTKPKPIESISAGPVSARRKLVWIAVASLAAVSLVALGAWLARGRSSLPPHQLVQVTSLIGSETMPSFSPDGQQLAFVWNGEKEDNTDIYVKMVGSETALRLTSNPGADLLPSWSPDGRQIAFVRVQGATGIYLVSPLGGREQKLVELPGVDHRARGPETAIVGDLLYPIVNRPSWSADGKFLALARYSEPPEPGDGVVLRLPVNGGDPRPILSPPPGAWYKHPTFSPDGRSLAVALCKGPNECQIQLVPLSPELLPEGEPKTILPPRGQFRGIAWMPDGNSLIVAGFSLPHFYSWRVSTKKPAEPERIEMAGADAIWPAISRRGSRFAFARNIVQADLWRLELGGKWLPFLSSTARDTFPQFSPDGKRIAFQSARGGANDIWVAKADGTEAVQITKKPDGDNGAPIWSPDGKWLAFGSSRKGGGSDVWIVDSEGGPPRQLTHAPGSQGNPSWSHDGRFINFSSDRSGRREVWRMPVEGGAAKQITQNGAVVPIESTDGMTLYYEKDPARTDGIFALPLAGGVERRVISDPIVRFSFAVVPDGIYYITPRDEKFCDIRFYKFADGGTQVVAEIERPVAFGLSVSPDRKTFLSSRPVTGSDLMLIENFR